MSFTPAQFNTLVEALTIVLPLNSPADVQLKRFFKEHAKLGVRDRAIIAETVYAVLRHRRAIEAIATDGVPRKMALLALTRYQGMSSRELTNVLKKAEVTWLADSKSFVPKKTSLGIEAELPDWVVTHLKASMADKDILALGPDTVPALKALAGRFQLAVISNIDDDLFQLTQARLGINFDHVITAEQLRAYKPDSRFFKTAMQRIAVPPGRILHVAQSLYHDIAPATALGFDTVWIDRHDGRGGGATLTGKATPTWTLRSLSELVAALKIAEST